MKDRKNDPNYKSISGFIPSDLSERIKKQRTSLGLTQNELLEEACYMWLHGQLPKPKNIHELVARNLSLLKDSGLTSGNLNAIAKGQVLPTRADFCEILTCLDVPEDERQRLWELAYGTKKDDCKQHSRTNQ